MRTAAALATLVALASAAAADPPAPTRDQALATLAAWVDAQNHGDFAAYATLYDAAFIGMKRTGDGDQTAFTLAQWKLDRKKMFKATQKIAAEDPTVSIARGLVTIHFRQRYQRGTYEDHGDKELVLRLTAGGKLAIAREEMLYSSSGWGDGNDVDASDLVSPITAVVHQPLPGGSHGGDCATVVYTLELTDAHHKTVTQDLGSGIILIADGAHDYHPDPDGSFQVGAWCAGGGDYFQVRRSGDALVVRTKSDEEDAPDAPPSPPAAWQTQLTIKLPPHAEIK